MNLSAIDLNLLLVLSVVLEERSATRAARRLHVTQSAVSNALARLRARLRDPLVVRSGRGLVPTPRAEQLAPALAAALRQLELAALGERPFDPETCTREFALACADSQQLADLPRLSRALERELPRARLRVVSIDTLLATDGLATGEVDLSISPREAHPGLHAVPLYTETMVGVVRRDHPLRGKQLTPRAFATIPQIALTIALGRAGVGNAMAERAFRAHGLTREIALSVPSFATAALVAASTDRLVCMPRRVAAVLAEHFPLRLLEPPMQGLAIELCLVWHARTDADPAVAYLRELIVRTLRDAPSRGGRAAGTGRAAGGAAGKAAGELSRAGAAGGTAARPGAAPRRRRSP